MAMSLLGLWFLDFDPWPPLQASKPPGIPELVVWTGGCGILLEHVLENEKPLLKHQTTNPTN